MSIRDPSLAVVIPTFNRGPLLEQTLAPLLADPSIDEIVVVVDGSTDGTESLLRALALSDHRLQPQLQANAGKEAAREAGVRAATTDLVLLLDDDVVAGPGLAAGHTRMHRETPGPGLVVVGYMPVEVPRRSRLNTGPVELYATDYERRVTSYERDPDLILQRLWGGNVSLPRRAAVEVGFVAPHFTAPYHQDRDFGLRCRQAGLAGAFSRSLRATHLYRRGLEAFARDARHQGAGRAQLHAAFPAELGALGIEDMFDDLPAGLREFLHSSRRPRVYGAIRPLLAATADLLWRTRTFGASTIALKLLRRVELVHGALHAGADWPHFSPGQSAGLASPQPSPPPTAEAS